MTALAAARLTDTLGADAKIRTVRVPLAASTKVWAGSQVMIDAGYLKPAAVASGKLVVGRARATYDNSSGAAGDVVGEVERGVFGWDIGTSGDVLAQADVGSTVYAVDDHTVGKLAGGTTAVAEVKTGTPTAADTTVYSLDVFIAGVDQLFNFTITSGASATATTIVTALKAAMAANSEFTALVTASGTATLILTRTTAGAGNGFSVTNVGAGTIAIANTTPASGGTGRSAAGVLLQIENGLAFVESF